MTSNNIQNIQEPTVIDDIETTELLTTGIPTVKTESFVIYEDENKIINYDIDVIDDLTWYSTIEVQKITDKDTNEDNSSIKLVINKKVFNCTLCRKKFINISQLENHLAKHKKKTTVKKNTYKCDICGKMFHLNFTLNRHLKKLHSSTKLNVQSNK